MTNGATMSRRSINGGIAGQAQSLQPLRDIVVGVIKGQGTYPVLPTEGNTRQESPMVAQVAWWLEFGTKKIRARHIFRRALAANKNKNVLLRKRLLRGLIRRRITAGQAIGLLGESVQSDIVKEVTAQKAVRTGKFKQSIKWAIAT